MKVAGYYGFMLNAYVSSFPDDNLSKCQWIFTNLVVALRVWRSGLGLLMDKFR